MSTFVPALTPGVSYLNPAFGETVRRLTTDRSLGKFLTLERVCPSVAAASRRGASTQDNGGVKLWIENVVERLERCASVCYCQSCSWWPPRRWRRRPRRGSPRSTAW